MESKSLEKKYNRSHIGETHITKESLGGYELTIIDGSTKPKYVTIQINDWVSEKGYKEVKNGSIKYPYHPSIYGKGYVGEGDAKITLEGKITKVYKTWSGMIERVYDSKRLVKDPTYKNVEVCNEWLNFNTFAKWFEENYIEGYHLDKDLLSTDNKIYSPETCIFIPQALNKFLTNIKVTNTSGHIGVSWHKNSNRWVAQIKHPKTGKRIHLGLFKDIEEASKVYKHKRNEYAMWWKYIASKEYNLPKKAINNIN